MSTQISKVDIMHVHVSQHVLYSAHGTKMVSHGKIIVPYPRERGPTMEYRPHPPILGLCKVHCPWVLFREGTVFICNLWYIRSHIHINTTNLNESRLNRLPAKPHSGPPKIPGTGLQVSHRSQLYDQPQGL